MNISIDTGIGSNLNIYSKGSADERNEVRNPIFLLRVRDSMTLWHKAYVLTGVGGEGFGKSWNVQRVHPERLESF